MSTPSVHHAFRIVAASLIAAAFSYTTTALACTAFCAVGGGQVLVGNNEDSDNPHTKLWFIPAKPGAFGRMYVGFDNMWPQGGMNERGLWFDGFAVAPIGTADRSGLPEYPGNLVDAAMAECSTVEEVIRLFSRYDRRFLMEGILMFADATGDAVAIERNAIVRKAGPHFVQTNFHQSRSGSEPRDHRFVAASTMLEQSGGKISVDLFRGILAATRQQGPYPTLYSNVYDLKSRTMYLYHFQDFERVVTFHLVEELKKGERVLDIPALFPPNAAAEEFAKRTATPTGGAPLLPIAIGLVVVVVSAAGLGLYGFIKSGRQGRIAIVVVIVVTVGTIAMGIASLHMHPAPSGQWIQFSIGPAAGQSVGIQPSQLRANGITLKAAVATAYDIPAVRVIAPPWLEQTRYSINAVAGIDQSEAFRSLLQEELKKRLNLETHREVRSFDVFVLQSTAAPRVERTDGERSAVRINQEGAQLREAPMAYLASALQSILGKPVIDETGLKGSFNLEFAWTADRVASITSTLHDRFGLTLTPTKRDMEVLVVDRIRRDAGLVLLEHVGRIMAPAPPHLRERIADIFSTR